ncbi:tetraspanin-2A [Agrilus planipennis]|uniref:Tetraspanin n=1 Tax=Agrilus planipennis TaxID=224129 RepID=A0A7F5R2J2_AGRPL|nr:tetraspanin-2A [Agrilus planipennis]
MIGASIFALCCWLRFEPGIGEWVTELDLQVFYIGLYILILGAIIMMVVAFIGCLSALQENSLTLFVYIVTQALGFVVAIVGSAVLLEYSTRNSAMQPLIRESMRRLIINSHYDKAQYTLAMIQENVGCCGADGPHDYISLQHPLPTTCRDTVTGNPFFHGCVDELTWFFEEKTAWVTGLAMIVALIHVINAVLGLVLIQALKKEEDEAEAYRR